MTDNIFDLAAFAETKPTRAMVLNIVRMFYKASMNDLQTSGTVMFRTAEGGEVHRAKTIDDVAQIVVEVLQHMIDYVVKEFDDLEHEVDRLDPHSPNVEMHMNELKEIGAVMDTFDMIGETINHVFGEPITEEPLEPPAKKRLTEEEQHRKHPPEKDKEEEEWEKWLEEQPLPPDDPDDDDDDDDSEGPIAMYEDKYVTGDGKKHDYEEDDFDEDDPDAYVYERPIGPPPPEKKEEEKKE